MPRKEKENPKWKEENITAHCKYCDKLYIANKMLDKGFKIVFPNGKTYVGSNEFFYFCNEKCLGSWKIANPNRIPKPENEGMIKIEQIPNLK